MRPESEKYNTVIDLLRKSKPILYSSEEIEKEVINEIKKVNHHGLFFSEIVDFLFGWIYIGWVRRSLIAASAVLILVFVYQQGEIIKRIDTLSRQIVVNEKANTPGSSDGIEKLLMVYRNSGRRFPSKTITISERQIDELIKSVNELQIKYKDIENLIENDPELKKLIEKKLLENSSTKTNL